MTGQHASANRRSAILLACVLCLAMPLVARPAQALKVTAVRFWSVGNVTRVAIETSAGFHYRADRLPNPERIFFDIVGARPDMGRSKGMHVIPVGDALLKQIRVAETQPGMTRVVLDLERPVEYEASQLSNPSRLMIELRTAERTSPSLSPGVARATRLTESTARAVAPDLAGPATAAAAAPVASPPAKRFRKASLSFPHQDRPVIPEPELIEPPVMANLALLARAYNSPRIPSELVRRRELAPPPPDPGTTLARSPSAASAPELHAPAAKIPPPPALTAPDKASGEEPDSVPLPAKRNTNGDRSLTRVLGLKMGRVVLDPGHGGHDVGTHGPTGLLEKDLVLDVAKRLGTLIEERMGAEVFYTRTDDTFVPLEERTRFANEKKADLFLSIHANSSPLRSASGVETYYLNFTSSKTALDVAARENASSEKSIFDLKELLQKIALKDKLEESREFATRIQNSLYRVGERNGAPARNRGVKKAPFVVLIGASMPSVLTEIGFISNASNEALMKKPEYRQKIAEALYKGLSAYASTLSHFEVAKRE